MSEKEFRIFINSEIVARRIYDYMVKDNTEREYVDVDTFATIELLDSETIETLYNIKKLLSKEYEVDLMTLPFRYETIKQELQEYISNVDNDIKI